MSDTPIHDSLNTVQLARVKMNAQYGKVSAEDSMANRDAYEAALLNHVGVTEHAEYVSAYPDLDTEDDAIAYSDSDSIHMVEETPITSRLNSATRNWIYRIGFALAVILVGWQGWQAVQLESWLNLIAAVLGLGGVGVASLAKANVR